MLSFVWIFAQISGDKVRGGGATLKEHKEKGADLEKDVSYQYLKFFLEDDAQLERIGTEYKAGRMTTGEVKKVLIGVLQEIVKKHIEARAKVTEDMVDHFMSVRKLKFEMPE